ncbi:MAG: TetR/AcrR family transcriptional regulator [Draconibacterium sp.]
MAEGKRRRRNAIAVKIDLIDAVGEVLKKYGFAKLGINLVAQEAQVDKNVIYRNYGEFDKLLEAYIEKQDFWFMSMKEYGKEEIGNKRAFMKYLLADLFKVIYSNKEFQQLLIWELGDKDDFTTDIAIKREVLAEGIFDQYRSLLDEYGIKFNSIAAILISSIYYLVLHREKSTFCETDLTKKSERDDFVKTIEWLTDLLFDKIEAISETERIAINALREGIKPEVVAKISGLSSHKINILHSNYQH